MLACDKPSHNKPWSRWSGAYHWLRPRRPAATARFSDRPAPPRSGKQPQELGAVVVRMPIVVRLDPSKMKVLLLVSLYIPSSQQKQVTSKKGGPNSCELSAKPSNARHRLVFLVWLESILKPLDLNQVVTSVFFRSGSALRAQRELP